MQRETPPDFEVPASDHEAHDWANVIGLMPELPSLGARLCGNGQRFQSWRIPRWANLL